MRTTLKVLLTILILAANSAIFFYAGIYLGTQHGIRVTTDQCVDVFLEHYEQYHPEVPLEPSVEPDAI